MWQCLGWVQKPPPYCSANGSCSELALAGSKVSLGKVQRLSWPAVDAGKSQEKPWVLQNGKSLSPGQSVRGQPDHTCVLQQLSLDEQGMGKELQQDIWLLIFFPGQSVLAADCMVMLIKNVFNGHAICFQEELMSLHYRFARYPRVDLKQTNKNKWQISATYLHFKHIFIICMFSPRIQLDFFSVAKKMETFEKKVTHLQNKQQAKQAVWEVTEKQPKKCLC